MKRKLLVFVSFVVLMFALVGCCKKSEINVPEDYSTIQEAIDHSSGNVSIVVAPGEYKGFYLNKSNINIKSSSENEQDIVSKTVIVDGGNDDALITFDKGSDGSELNGFTFTKAEKRCLFINDSNVTVKNCIFANNSLAGEDNLMDVKSLMNTGTSYFENCKFMNNQLNGSILKVVKSKIDLKNIDIVNNKTFKPVVNFLITPSCQISDSNISNNYSKDSSIILCMLANVNIYNSSISENTTEKQSCIKLNKNDGAMLSFVNSIIIDNKSLVEQTIKLKNISGILLVNNYIHNNKSYELSVEESDKLYLSGNSMYRYNEIMSNVNIHDMGDNNDGIIKLVTRNGKYDFDIEKESFDDSKYEKLMQDYMN